MTRIFHHKRMRLLDLEKPLFVRRKMTAGGREWDDHEEFKWMLHGISAQTVGMLFRQRRISHFKEGDFTTPLTTTESDARQAEVYADPLTDADGLRLDGPTVEEWVAAGYLARVYPPNGYRMRKSPGLTKLQNELVEMDEKEWTERDCAIITADPVE